MSATAHTDLQAALDAEHAQRLALQHHAADQAQRVADLEAEIERITECGRAHIRRAACLESERDTARGALRELERQVFALQQQRDVLQTCLDRHQRDAADPPGYLQDAVIRAAGLGALHEQRDAAIKERDELLAALREIAGEFAPGSGRQTYGPPAEAMDRIRDASRAAIAEAEGGAA